MADIKFNFDGIYQDMQQEIPSLLECLDPEIERIQQARSDGYNSVYASINVPFDQEILLNVKEIAEKKQKLEPAMVIVIGIGGSNLGTLAIYEALFGSISNDFGGDPFLYYVDMLDQKHVTCVYALAESFLAGGENILINVVSKSGTTTETIANFLFFVDLLKQYKKDAYRDFIVVTTDEDSKLYHFARDGAIDVLTIPEKVGGRFSVFTAVGLLPLALLQEVNLDELLQGAQKAFETNVAAKRAAVLYQAYKQGYVIHDVFLFARSLESLGKWYRQLLAESIGKKENIHHKVIEVGPTPTVSIGSTDLHSMGQLYLGGPRNKITTFVVYQKDNQLTVPTNADLQNLVPNIQGKTMAQIMQAMSDGAKAAYKKNHRPFMDIVLSEISEKYVGELLQTMMLEIMYLGFLFEVNPFDQPQVELYKKETRELLSK